MIIGITGLHRDVNGAVQTIGAGKDAAAETLIKKHGFVRIGIADHIKRICKSVFDFSDEQLWGPSQERNKPDLRYPRGGKNGPRSMENYLSAKTRRVKLEKERPADYAMEHPLALQDEATYESMAFLTPRYALQQLGTEWGRNCYDSVWIEDALRTASNLLTVEGYKYTEHEGLTFSVGYNKPVGVVFSDVRFHNEYESIKKAGGKLVRIKRFSWQPLAGNVGAAHTSETELIGYGDDKFDHILENGGDLHHLELLVSRMYDIFSGRMLPYDEAQKDVPPFLRT